MILGLDVSTSIVGATMLDNDGKIVYCDAWDLRKYKDHFKKAEVVKDELCNPRFDDVTYVIIEKLVSSFSALEVLQRKSSPPSPIQRYRKLDI